MACKLRNFVTKMVISAQNGKILKQIRKIKSYKIKKKCILVYWLIYKEKKKQKNNQKINCIVFYQHRYKCTAYVSFNSFKKWIEIENIEGTGCWVRDVWLLASIFAVEGCV